jgi:glycosyltransferase involved in cell wall biosynthesis
MSQTPSAVPPTPATRVCHVIFEHRSFDGRVFFKEAATLARAGYEVVVLAPGLSGRWLGKRKDHPLPQDEPLVRHGIRFETYPYRRWIPRAFGMRRAAGRRDILRALERIRPDVCHFHEDGVTMEAAAELKRHLPRVKLIFDYHEFFLHRLRLTDAKRRTLRRFIETENRVLASADGLVTVSDFISDYYRTLTGKPVVTVMNSQSAALFKAGHAPPSRPDGFWVIHEGRMMFDRGLRTLVEAVRRIRSPRVRFLLIGGLPPGEREWFEKQTATDGTRDRFMVTGMLPYLEVPGRMEGCDAGLCLVEAPNGLTGVPNKFFNYLRFGLPVLTLEHPIMGPLVRRSGCGEVIPRDGAAEALALAIDRLAGEPARAAEMSAAAARLFGEELNWEAMETRLLGLYREVLQGHAD